MIFKSRLDKKNYNKTVFANPYEITRQGFWFPDPENHIVLYEPGTTTVVYISSWVNR